MRKLETALFQKVTNSVKGAIIAFDPSADVILFGSRARGDYSDWDFLTLTDREVNMSFKNEVRRVMFDVELELEIGIFCLVENREDWNERDFLEINQNVKEDGVLI